MTPNNILLFLESEKSLMSLERVARDVNPETSIDLETPEEIERRSYGAVLRWVSPTLNFNLSKGISVNEKIETKNCKSIKFFNL